MKDSLSVLIKSVESLRLQVGVLVAPDAAAFGLAARAVAVFSHKLTRIAVRAATRAFSLSEPDSSFGITPSTSSSPVTSMQGKRS